jgi:hypothetical protein
LIPTEPFLLQEPNNPVAFNSSIASAEPINSPAPSFSPANSADLRIASLML